MRATVTQALVVRQLRDNGELYGLQIIEATGVSSGTLYPMLLRWQQQGLVRVRTERQTDAPSRRWYRLTKRGEKEADDMVARWRQVLA